ncbi:acyl-CoA dehydrogenase family protein [Actinoplanes sp. NPDC023801]|uniref:acyl-CoA dehydrogenase family protein n=1 Tax=Actinoplanes sp. NPDC023801 TaxID=3154595 RepID=UPI0033D68D21
MRLAPSGEQNHFAAVLHEMLSEAPAHDGAGPDRRLWAALGDAGVTGLMIPERAGGLGAGADDLVIACEQLGRHAVAGPVAESVAAVPLLLGPDDERLAGLAAGQVIASLAAPPWLPYALDGDSADLILLVDGDAVRLGRAGAVHQSADPARRLADVECGALLGTGRPIRQALDLGVLACSAQLLGAGQALLDMSVGYARTRTQFGRPIGSFQAVRHRLADVAVALDFARPLLYAAAVAWTGPHLGAAAIRHLAADHAAAAVRDTAGHPGAAAVRDTAADLDAGRDVSAAKVACGQAALLAARTALQVHGAIGYTAEHRLGRHLTLVRALHLSWGTPDQHRARVLAAITGTGTAPDGRATAGDPAPQPVSRLGAASGADVAWPSRGCPESAGAGIARTDGKGSE